MAGDCGSCTACCRVFAIPQIEKQAGDWCQHCDVGVGCKIYETRPKICVDFACLWLQSRAQPDARLHMPDALRPDRCKVVFSPATDPTIMGATTMPGAPDAWTRKPVQNFIRTLIGMGLRVVVGQPNSTEKIMLDRGGMRRVEMTKPDANGMQWSLPRRSNLK